MKPVALMLLLLFVMVLGVTGLGAQGAVPDQAAAVAETVHRLAAIRPPNEEIPTDVPQAARPLLTQLKHELRNLILNTVNDPASRGLNTMQLTQSVLQKLKTAGVQVGGHDQPEYFGGISRLKIVEPSGHPELRGVTTTVHLSCGSDTSLYILRRQASKWAVIISVESNDYPDISGALGDFGYGISEPDESGKWFLVMKYVQPWCTSRWHSIHCRVLRPGPSPTKPVVPLIIHVGNVTDEPNTLTVGKHDFTLVNVGGQSLDGAILTRIHVHRYSVSGDRVTRVPPIAVIPQDFVAEWVELPLEEAMRWSDAPAMSGIESWHSRLQEGTTDNDYYYSEFEFVQPCSQSPNRWQIGLSIDSEKRQDKLPLELFFTVSKRNGAFYMTDISQKRAPGCPGEAHTYYGLPWKLLKEELNKYPNSGSDR